MSEPLPDPTPPLVAKPPFSGGTPTPPAAEPVAPPLIPPLTPEEQMERFAQDLKENDWGHQPC